MIRALSLALVLLAAAPVAAAERIVVAAGALTEFVFALGAGAEVVGVDTTSRYPAAVATLPKIGYMRALSAEGILSLRPTLLIASDHAGPPAVIAQIRAAGVRVASVPDGFTPESAMGKARLVASALGRAPAGAALAARMKADFARVREAQLGIKARPRVMFVLSLGRGAPMVSGAGTAADAMIALAGGVNAFPGYEGYKPVSTEAAVAADADVLLTMSQAVESIGGEAAFLAVPQIAVTTPGRWGRLVALDGTFLLGFGPRTPEAVCALTERLHETRQAAGCAAVTP